MSRGVIRGGGKKLEQFIMEGGCCLLEAEAGRQVAQGAVGLGGVDKVRAGGGGKRMQTSCNFAGLIMICSCCAERRTRN